MGNRGIGFRFLARETDFSLVHSVQIVSWVYPASSLRGIEGFLHEDQKARA
jgi:hypothetical protein